MMYKQYATRWSLPPMLAHLLFCRGLYAFLRSTTVEIALQISSILTNKPKVKYAKIIINTYVTMRYGVLRHLVIQTNKPNSKPI